MNRAVAGFPVVQHGAPDVPAAVDADLVIETVLRQIQG